MKPSNYFSRRSFLAGMGLGTGMLPLLGPDHLAFGQAGAPRRLIVVVQTNGTIADAFFPKGSPTASSLDELTLPAITEPLEKHKKDLLFIENLELKNFTEQPNNGGAHDNYSNIFTGALGEQRDVGDPRGFRPPISVSPTFDNFIVDSWIKKGPISTPIPKLHLASQIENAGVGQKRCFWRGRNQPISPENNPAKVASTLFSGTGMADPEIDRLRAERKSMLDYVGRDLETFAKRFGKDEKSRVDSHLHSVREVERQLGALQKFQCGRDSVVVPAALADAKGNPDMRIADIMKIQFDLAVASLACNATRIATVQLNNGHGNDVVFSWLGLSGKGMEFGIRDSHDLAHRPGAMNVDKIKAETWYMSQFAELIDRVKAVKEPGGPTGTMLDSTAILWVNHMGNGGGHSSTKLPWVIAGRAGGYFKTGQFARSSKSVAVNGVLIALCNAMGAPTETFGDPKYGGELTSLKA